ncbi:hypothetical protein CKA27_25770 [Vibrio coralliilyticus]|nr:hypothetical protein CKA27_25770 [Vibrio coralliilyticus]
MFIKYFSNCLRWQFELNVCQGIARVEENMKSIINSLRICHGDEQMLQMPIAMTYATALSTCHRYFPL